MEGNDLITSYKNKKNNQIEFIQNELDTLKKSQKYTKIILYCLVILNIILIIIIMHNNNHIDNQIKNSIKDIFFEISNKIYNEEKAQNNDINNIKLNNSENKKFENNSKENNKIEDKNNNILLNQYINEQNEFCQNKNKYLNKEIEEKIQLTSFEFDSKKFQMFVYKENDKISKSIIKEISFENKPINNLLKALQLYGEKNSILNNKDIYIIDIGGNIGYFDIILGNFGYSIISFEP